jgi:hypothetical protein
MREMLNEGMISRMLGHKSWARLFVIVPGD